MRKTLSLLATFVLTFNLFAQEAPARGPARLPVKRIVLYKNGVGYFEHVGKVRGNQDLTIDFTSAQLNDVLKSLTVIDMGEGRVTGVRYDSTAPLSERMKTLRLPVGEQTTPDQFLNALRGARIEVRSAATTTIGKLLSVQKSARTDDKGNTQEITEVALVTDAGELRTFDLKPGVGVRLLERDLSEDVGKYLDLVGSTRSRDLRRMVVSTAGTGERDLYVGYISEVPVWKSTYRILLPSRPGAKPRIQGWAIVDNTIGEDWNDVQLSLVAGSVQSFVQQMSTPLYSRRPVVGLPTAAQMTPQSHEATMNDRDALAINGRLVQPPTAKAAPSAGFVGAGSGGGVSAGIGSGFGGGMVAGRVGASAQTVEVTSENRSWLDSAVAEQMPIIAAGVAAADLFRYDLQQKITIGKNQSALVPILNAPIDAEKVTMWSGGRALRALWLKNTSDLTLDSGTFNILDAETFAGEGLIQELKPGERRLVSYAPDTAVRVALSEKGDIEPVTKVAVAKGTVRITRGERRTTTYELRNADKEARNVVVEHMLRAGWKVTGDAKPEESSASYHRFRVKIDPGKTAELKVEEYHPQLTTVALSSVTPELVATWVEGKALNPALEAEFRRILGKKFEISQLDEQLKARQNEVDSINSDQARVRENMKALKGSVEEKTLLQRYAQQLNQQEDRLVVLRKELDDLRGKKTLADGQLALMVQNVAFDEGQ